MIPAIYYQYIYIFLVLLLTLWVGHNYSYVDPHKYARWSKRNAVGSLIVCVFMIIFIGTRPASSVFVDMAGYAAHWDLWDQGVYSFNWDADNLLFDNLRIFMATAHIPYELFFLLIASLYFGCAYAACMRLFPRDTFFSFLVFLAAFSTFSYATNGIKAGAAASIFLLAVAYYDRPFITISLALVSWGFHHSMVMVVGSYLIVYMFHKPKWYFIMWALGVLIAALHITTFQSLFASMVDEQGAGYLEGQSHGKGFRLDFILYSSIPVLVGYYAIFRKKIVSKGYHMILCLYLLTNTIWMLCMYAEFTNRIAYLSWFIYPIVLIYPFLNEEWGHKKYIIAKRVSYAHIAFTLFMVLIFY